MKWWRVGIFVLLLAMFWAVSTLPDGKLHVIFCDVGQGDSGLVVKGDFQMLIDTGPKKGGVLDCLSDHLPFWDKKIEIVLSTHLQSDHFGAIEEIKRHYQIEKIITSATKGDRIRYGSLYFDVLHPDQIDGDQVLGANSDPNERAVVMIMKSPTLSVLFTSDIGVDQELALVSEGLLREVDVLKVAHHGSKYSSSLSFDEAVGARWAVISVGEKNNYGHPAEETLKRFDLVGSHVLRTDRDGEVEFVADEKRYWMVE